jgi:hypothetical protein
MSSMITRAAMEVFQAATCEGFRVKLNSGRLAEEVYAEVNEVLSRLGGHWKGGRTQAHCFEEDPSPLIAYTLATGRKPPKNPLAYFPSPKPVAEEAVAQAELDNAFSDGWFLEPSAGRAAIADLLAAGTELIPDIKDRLVLVEVNPLNVAVLKAKGYKHVFECSFLDWETKLRFDRVVANPPFSVAGNPTVYIDHILKMWDLTNEGGKVVTVAPDAWLREPDGEDYEGDAEPRITNRKLYEFRRFVEEHGYYVNLGKGRFKESGTMTGTVIIVLDKLYERERRAIETRPCEGYLNYYCFVVDLIRRNERERYEESLRIFNRIRRGELPINLLGEAIGDTYRIIRRQFVECVREMRKEGAHLPMRERYYDYLVNEVFMEAYAEWHGEEEAKGNSYEERERMAA